MTRNHILLVDDDYLINLELGEFLRDAGFTVESVYSGFAAFAALKRRPPCALVTDVNLGAGPNGFEVARCARNARPGLPVVFISSNFNGLRPADAMAGSDFIPKPFSNRQVLEALGRAHRLEVA